MHQSVLCQQAVRCGATTHTAQLEMRREPRETAEQVMRREPQLGAELSRDEKTKTRNENNSYEIHCQQKRNYSGSCGPGTRQSFHANTQNILCISSHTARCFGFCLSGSISLEFFSFVPFGRGVHAPGLGSQGRERAFNMHTFPPNTHTCLILVLMMVYSKCSTVSTTCVAECARVYYASKCSTAESG